MINYLKDEDINLKIKVIFYENYAILSEENNWDKYNELLDLYAKDKVDEIIVVDKNMYNFLKDKGYKVKYFLNTIEISNKESFIKIDEKYSNEYIKIGLYNAEDIWNKNIYNQLCAISKVENHELDCAPVNYKISMFARKHNINIVGVSEILDNDKLYQKMTGNDINLFVSLQEFPNTSAVESLELGTLCLVGRNNSYFVGTELEKYLVVNNENDIYEIIDKIKNALINKDEIFELYKKWKQEYDIKSNESILRIIEK